MKEAKFEIGGGATVSGYSQAYAHTVIDISKSGKTITIQRDEATLLNGMNSDAEDKLTITAGGYCGHVEGRQRYEFKRDPNGFITKASLRKNGRWVVSGENARTGSAVYDFRSEHYDYNF